MIIMMIILLLLLLLLLMMMMMMMMMNNDDGDNNNDDDDNNDQTTHLVALGPLPEALRLCSQQLKANPEDRAVRGGQRPISVLRFWTSEGLTQAES